MKLDDVSTQRLNASVQKLIMYRIHYKSGQIDRDLSCLDQEEVVGWNRR